MTDKELLKALGLTKKSCLSEQIVQTTHHWLDACEKIEELEKENARLRTRCKQIGDEVTVEMVCLQKENAELEEKISILLSCKNCPKNKGGLLCQKEYEDKCLTQKIQYIKELKEENAEMEAQIEKMKLCQNCRFEFYDDMEEPCRNCSRLLGDIKRKGTSDKWEMTND